MLGLNLEMLGKYILEPAYNSFCEKSVLTKDVPENLFKPSKNVIHMLWFVFTYIRNFIVLFHNTFLYFFFQLFLGAPCSIILLRTFSFIFASVIFVGIIILLSSELCRQDVWDSANLSMSKVLTV